MSIHIAAKQGEIADKILLPGDPLRAKFVAENFLEDAVCYNTVRNMLGFTGTYKGERVSVQGTGMGLPSLSIYVNELFSEYNVQRAIRIGTAGSIQKEIPLRSIILAMGASTDSGINLHRFNHRSFAPTANFNLLKNAYEAAVETENTPFVGSIASSDVFYDKSNSWKLWAEYGALCVEMETAELYTLAAQYHRQALAILTVSDSIITGDATTSEERQTTFKTMMHVALEAIIRP